MFSDPDRVSKYRFTIEKNTLHIDRISDYVVDIKVDISNIGFPCKLPDIIKFSNRVKVNFNVFLYEEKKNKFSILLN